MFTNIWTSSQNEFSFDVFTNIHFTKRILFSLREQLLVLINQSHCVMVQLTGIKRLVAYYLHYMKIVQYTEHLLLICTLQKLTWTVFNAFTFHKF